MEDYSQSSSRTRQIQNVWNICYGARDSGGVFFLFFLNRCGFKFGNNGNYISLFFISIFSLLLYLLLSSSQSPLSLLLYLLLSSSSQSSLNLLSLSFFIFFSLLHLNLLSSSSIFSIFSLLLLLLSSLSQSSLSLHLQFAYTLSCSTISNTVSSIYLYSMSV